MYHFVFFFYFEKSDENKEEMEPITDIILSDTNTPSKTNFLGVTIDTENGSNIRLRLLY